MPSKARIFFLSHSAGYFGAQRSLVDILSALDRARFEPIVGIPGKGILNQQVKNLGIEVVSVQTRNWLRNVNAYHLLRKRILCITNAKRLQNQLAGRNFDLIHTNSFVTPVGAMAAKRLNIPHVWHMREFFRNDPAFFYSKSRTKDFLADTTQAVVAISHELQGWLQQYVPNELIRVVHNGPLDTETMKPHSPSLLPWNSGEPFRLLCIGRAGKAKGVEDALNALGLLKKEGLNVRLSLVGGADAAYKAELTALISRLGVEDDVEFKDFTIDPLSQYRQNHATLMLSHYEPFGRVSVEALSQACPIIATDAGATKEIVRNDLTGLLVAPEQPAAVAQAVIRMMSNETERIEMTLRGYEDVWNRFTRQRLAADVAALYDSVLGG